MKYRAPAKINLSLRVLGRRSDGFHEVETLMVPLTLADDLEIEVGPEICPANGNAPISLRCDDSSLPTGPGNLAYRAAELFRRSCGREQVPIGISLAKRIPHGAGLGGGSSDAATVLLALNAQLGGPLDSARLVALAAELGSDVAFFLARGAARCRGRGERVEPAASTPDLPLLLLKPPFPIPTPWAYSRWRDAHELAGVAYAAQHFDWGELVNDLERPVFEKYLLLPALKNWLLAQPEVAGALLSGSGSTVFAVLRADGAGAETLTVRALEQFGELWTCACRTLGPVARPASGV